MAKKTRKPKRRPDRLTKLLKPIHKKNIHPELSFKKSALKVYLDTAQIAEMKQLAKEHGTTLAQELDNAVDAYLLGMSQGEIRMLHAALNHFSESLGRSNKVIDAALRKAEKNLAHLAGKRRSGQKSK